MKGWITAIFLIISGFGFGQIQVEEPSKELGDIYENKGKVSTFFTLENPYRKDTIHILDIITSCGCTAVLSQDTLILPLSSIQIEVSYDPKGRLGLFVKSIEIKSRTGKDVQSRLYLKISGNVVAENTLVKNNTHVDLIEYKVAPIFFYPITPYDTSYLDFNYIISFVNDLSYEIDFYQFTTLGIEVSVADKKYIEDIEYLLNFSRKKIIHEFGLHGFFNNTIFFDEPVFKYDEIPVWSVARIKLYSLNFNHELDEGSVIRLSADELVEDKNLMLSYERFARPPVEEILQEVNFEGLEGKLFMNSHLELKGIILTPKKTNEKENLKLAKTLEKKIFKYLKKTNGVTKDNVSIRFDSIGVHPDGKYKFMLWDKEDEEEQQKFSYEIKADEITPPLLPTYKQSTVLASDIDITNRDFKHFWKNIIQNHKAGHKIHLVIESSVSRLPRSGTDDNMVLAIQKGNKAKNFIMDLFEKETGRTLTVQVKALVRGPEYNSNYKDHVDYREYEYTNIIPVVHNNGPDKELNPQPYMVNFDYYFKGVDTSSWVFSKFARYLADAVEQDGYVELRMESSISQIQIEEDLSNEYIAYIRAHESEKRLRQFMKWLLIDDNRVIFTDERYIIQGPKFDGTIPIIKFRKFQYLKIVPEKYLNQ